MIRFLINRPISVLATITGLLILSLLTIKDFTISLLPNIAIPRISILVDGDSYTPLEMEHKVLRPIRRYLPSIGHIDEMQSTARWGTGEIQLSFTHGTDMERVFIETHEMVDLSMDALPDDLDRPRVIKSRSEDLPTHYLSLSRRENASEQEQALLSDYATSVLRPRLEQLSEIALVDIHGIQNVQIIITPDEMKMTSLGVDQAALQQALERSNLTFGSVVIKERAYQYRVRIGDPISDIRDLQSASLFIGDRYVTIGDLADVTTGLRQQEGLFLDCGQPAVSLAIIKSPDAKLDDLEKALNQIIKEVNDERGDLELTVYRDQTSLLEATLSNLTSSLILGCLLAVGLVFFFYSQWRIPLMIGIIIPTSIVLSLLLFRIAGLSINMISLAGILLGLGLMIDNGIIVLDNISQSWQDGAHGLENACIEGTREMITPLLTSMLTTCSVFLPLSFISGIAGALFGVQALVISIGLLVSYLVSITLLPTLYYVLLHDRHRPSVIRTSSLSRSLRRAYDFGFHWMLAHPLLSSLATVLVIGLGIVLVQSIPTQRFPVLPADSFEMAMDWNEPIHPAVAHDRLNNTFDDLPAAWFAHLGTDQYLLNNLYQGDISNAHIFVRPDDPDQSDGLRAILATEMQAYNRAIFSFHRTKNLFEQLFPEEDQEMEIRCYFASASESDQLRQYETFVKKLGQVVSGLHTVSYQKSYMIRPRSAQLLYYDVDPDLLIRELKRQLNQNLIFELRSFQYTVPVVIKAGQQEIEAIKHRSQIKNREGQWIPMHQLIDIAEERSQRHIYASARGRYWPVGITGAHRSQVQQIIDQMARDQPGTLLEVIDPAEQRKDFVTELALAAAVAILLLFFLMTAQFESFVQPIIILLEIPISLVGCLVTLWLFGNSINLMSMIGMIVTMGIIINDSIIKIDTINRFRHQGSHLRQAIHLGGLKRLNPIIMTSLTTILAATPFLWGSDIGSTLQRPLALSLIGGMLIGTWVSLYVIPLLYFLIYKNFQK